MYLGKREKETRTVPGMFKIVAVIAAIVLALLLTACGDKTEDSGSSGRDRSNGEAAQEPLRFDSPEEQYRYVAETGFNKAAENFAALYDNYLQAITLTEQSVDAELTLKLYEAATDMLESYTGMDFSWLKTLGVSADVNLAEEGVALEMALSLNGRDLIGVDFLVDLEDMEMYGRVPQLSSAYFREELDEYTLNNSGYFQMRRQQELIGAMLPDGDTVAKILSRCAEAALEQIEDVDEDSDTLTAGGVSAEYTTLTVTLTEDLLKDMTEAVCDVLAKDKDVEDIIVNLEAMTDTSIYDEFVEQLDRLPDQISMDGEIEITLYVDDSNTIRGRVIELKDFEFDQSAVIRCAAPEDGGDVGFELSVENDGELVCLLSGEGEKSGNTLDGTYVFLAHEMEWFTIEVEDFDTAKLDDGELIGKFTIKPTAELYLNAGASSLTARTMEDFSFALEAGRNELTFEVSMNGEPFVALTERVERGRGGRLPSVSGAKDISSWAESLMSDGSLQDYLNYLKNSDIPEELLQQLLGAAF